MAIWACLLIAVLLILSPMVWLRPSPGETLRSRLRQYVRRHGGELDFTRAPLARPDIALIGYRLRYPIDEKGAAFVLVRNRVASEALDAATPDWRWREVPLPSLDDARHQALAAWLESLPDDVLVVESREQTLRVWWQEGVGLERFEREWPTWLAMRDTLAGSGRKG
ncbi:preprotein translocase subunit YajC [Salinicola aestuarinus]|uniref:preprotein translocase subunit YajC n=1 Tax=Salinicola aestuarinus TaxID=1949082 RepID=UPI000DA1E948|nr:preprotein translocase subunit YajC [Salinicola aestuarinus]